MVGVERGVGGDHRRRGRQPFGVSLLGQIPLLPRLREGGDDGRPITAVDPESEPARAFREIAERVAVELKPKKVFSAQLKVN